jgi:hypothetical protein
MTIHVSSWLPNYASGEPKQTLQTLALRIFEAAHGQLDIVLTGNDLDS